jgi:hypothetical protein
MTVQVEYRLVQLLVEIDLITYVLLSQQQIV